MLDPVDRSSTWQIAPPSTASEYRAPHQPSPAMQPESSPYDAPFPPAQEVDAERDLPQQRDAEPRGLDHGPIYHVPLPRRTQSVAHIRPDQSIAVPNERQGQTADTSEEHGASLASQQLHAPLHERDDQREVQGMAMRRQIFPEVVHSVAPSLREDAEENAPSDQTLAASLLAHEVQAQTAYAAGEQARLASGPNATPLAPEFADEQEGRLTDALSHSDVGTSLSARHAAMKKAVEEHASPISFTDVGTSPSARHAAMEKAVEEHASTISFTDVRTSPSARHAAMKKAVEEHASPISFTDERMSQRHSRPSEEGDRTARLNPAFQQQAPYEDPWPRLFPDPHAEVQLLPPSLDERWIALPDIATEPGGEMQQQLRQWERYQRLEQERRGWHRW
ncbi:hypothetical protein EYB53_011310 [Candidatus Chloroploca sp. M-50]|uniref:Uncharacterized protein n=1 Tax=Candidatus Chloroploca mongolica TaxID=2528176 RepID=A0ABS4DA22_9CHLR|nr:hypothetical protein [Candidatus Chloroploca mongolica]MBP1466294.1 hypothetical protein [Candidatus Chloroploca mongolica]